MKILLELFAGIMLWIVLSIGRRTIDATAHRAKVLDRIRHYLPATAAIIWFLYGFWLLYRWVYGNTAFPYLLFFYIAIPTVLVAWYVLRDVMAGVVSSGRDQFDLNLRIQIGELSGRIVKKGATHVELQTDNGDSIHIPYSRLSREIVIGKSEDSESDYHRIHLKVSRQKQPDQLQADILRDIRSSPWATAATAPVVRYKQQENASCEFEILFRSLNSRHASRIERALRETYEK